MMLKRFSLCVGGGLSCTLMLLGLGTSIANAASHEVIVEPPQAVETWYQALGSLNRQAFEELISDDAKITLKDLGIEQTKQEFIASLDEWERATGSATIVYRYEDIGEGTASVLVCYRFKNNETLTGESFTYDGAQITGSIQEPRGDSCKGF